VASTAETDRINVRVERSVKRDAEDILKSLGLNLSAGINIFLHRLVAESGIPFQLTLTREEVIGAEAAAMEVAAGRAVQSAVAQTVAAGACVARFDDVERRPYLEYPDGRREYPGGA
jgi:addiction module RelB/DinJ family antitoxin